MTSEEDSIIFYFPYVTASLAYNWQFSTTRRNDPHFLMKFDVFSFTNNKTHDTMSQKYRLNIAEFFDSEAICL